MRKTFWIWIFLSSTLSRAEILSLEDCLRMAEQSSLKLSIADRRVLIAKDKKLESLGSILPKLTVESRVSTRNNDQGFKTSEADLVFGERTLGTSRFGLLVPIYDFGGAANQLKAVNSDIRASRFESIRARAEVNLMVTYAYFRILEALKIQQVVEESILAVEEQLKISKDFYSQGLVAKNDVLVAEVQGLKRQQELIQAKNNVELATSTLNRWIGLKLTEPTVIEDVLEIQTDLDSFDALVEVAIEQRPELKITQENSIKNKALYKASRSSFFPKIFGFGDWNYTSDSRTINPTWFSTGFGMSLTLWDASTYAQIRARKKQVEEAQDLERDRQADLMLEVQSAYLGVKQADQLLPVAKKSIELAAENLRITKDRYAEGLATAADVLVDEERLAKARSDYYSALYRYHQAIAELNYATGNPVNKANQARMQP